MRADVHIHGEGVEVLKWFGFVALILFLVVLRFSDVVPNLFGNLLEWASTRFPARKRRRGRTFKLSYQTKVRQKIAFWILCGAVGVFLLAEWFLIPEAYQFDRVLLLPLACAAFAGGSVVIGIGPTLDEHGSKWQRWPFWITAITTSASVFALSRLLNARTPRGVFAVLILSLIPFVWIKGFMDYVDQQLLESQELGLTKDYDGSKPLVPARFTSPWKSRRRSERSAKRQRATHPSDN